jgi:ATP-dependent helicase HrpB
MAVIEPWLSAVTSLKGLNLLSIFNAQLGPDEQLWLDKYYPTKILAPDGSFVPIDYNSETGPVATAKLQQFFGQVEFPSVGPPGNSTPVTLSLLSPSGKPLAQTIDLSFFWRETYPLVRAEMRGRYPKHPWPDDPLTAAATKMTNKQVMKSSECVQTGQTIERRKSRRKKS